MYFRPKWPICLQLTLYFTRRASLSLPISLRSAAGALLLLSVVDVAAKDQRMLFGELQFSLLRFSMKGSPSGVRFYFREPSAFPRRLTLL